VTKKARLRILLEVDAASIALSFSVSTERDVTASTVAPGSLLVLE
jgi:hypothetical protein